MALPAARRADGGNRVPDRAPVRAAVVPAPAAPRLIAWADLQLGDLLGAGGFGSVLAAEWRDAEAPAGAPPAPVAVKLLPVDATPAARRQFEREVGLLAALRHPRLVLIHGVCQDARGVAGSLALVMERCAGSLSDALYPRDEAIPELDAAQCHRFMHDLLDALVFLHAQQPPIVHGDIKPLNCLLTAGPPPQLRVADFGLSTAAATAGVHSQRTTAAGGGTLMYSAPEMLDEDHRPSRAQDIYAWAATCTELFSRQKPWPGMNDQRILAQLMRRQTPRVPDAVPEPIRALLQLCLQADPAARPRAAAIQAVLQRELPRPDDAPAAAAPAECCICFTPVDGDAPAGLRCPGSHFVCAECAVRLIGHAIEPARLRREQGRIKCPADGCAERFTAGDIDRLPNRAAVQQYMRAMQEFVALLLGEPAEAAAPPGAPGPASRNRDALERAPAAAAAAANLASAVIDPAAVHRHRLHIAEQLLPLRCPGCRRVCVLDYDGCNALTCEHCGAHFCAMCLANGGANVYAHIREQHPDQLYGQHFALAAARDRRERAVIQYLQPLPPRMQAAIIQACWRDFQDLGLHIDLLAERTVQNLADEARRAAGREDPNGPVYREPELLLDDVLQAAYRVTARSLAGEELQAELRFITAAGAPPATSVPLYFSDHNTLTEHGRRWLPAWVRRTAAQLLADPPLFEQRQEDKNWYVAALVVLQFVQLHVRSLPAPHPPGGAPAAGASAPLLAGANAPVNVNATLKVDASALDRAGQWLLQPSFTYRIDVVSAEHARQVRTAMAHVYPVVPFVLRDQMQSGPDNYGRIASWGHRWCTSLWSSVPGLFQRLRWEDEPLQAHLLRLLQQRVTQYFELRWMTPAGELRAIDWAAEVFPTFRAVVLAASSNSPQHRWHYTDSYSRFDVKEVGSTLVPVCQLESLQFRPRQTEQSYELATLLTGKVDSGYSFSSGRTWVRRTTAPVGVWPPSLSVTSAAMLPPNGRFTCGTFVFRISQEGEPQLELLEAAASE